MRIALGNDHRGALIREPIIEHLKQLGHDIIDFGTNSETSIDYPDVAARAGRAVAAREADRAILVCGTGIGMCIAANKVDGVRCAVCTDEIGARMSRLHNDANALALRATDMDLAHNLALIDVFLSTEFEGGRHQVRVDKICRLECGGE